MVMEVRFLHQISECPSRQWDALGNPDSPFLRHAFLAALEDSGCVHARSGWQPLHGAVFRAGKLIAALPLYLKGHSMGEYVFDWAWAQAYQEQGLAYYPKLLTAVPFTPAPGPRLLVANGEDPRPLYPLLSKAIRSLAHHLKASSWHILFPTSEEAQHWQQTGLSLRRGCQFQWFNQDYADFGAFLGDFKSRQRKRLKRERRRISEQGLELHRIPGTRARDSDWEFFFHCYQLTYAKHGQHGYLSQDFFERLATVMPENLLLVRADRAGEAVASALYLTTSSTLYGRYWGCLEEFDALHFEACYYQGIEHCIEQKIPVFNAGAQGEHKLHRGFQPVSTWSAHWLKADVFSNAIEKFLRQEDQAVKEYQQLASRWLPFHAEWSARPAAQKALAAGGSPGDHGL